MLSIKIEETSSCVRKLLVDTVFDTFLLVSATVQTGVTYFVDGRVNSDFYDSDERKGENISDYITWAEIKPHVYNIIKGKKLPLGFKFVFKLSERNVMSIIEKNHLTISASNVANLTLNIYYDGSSIHATTMATMNVFSADKTMERLWDESVTAFFRHYEIV